MRNITKAIAKAYLISGDMNGYNGRKSNELRRSRMYLNNDGSQIAKDWKNTGLDMQKALNTYSKRQELQHG
ncbi:hypothetical protein [Staphylococcus simulans]|uniref:hypothetical protein n=1 Tax=Staphylococcus simulans TaxID=1286 RepID=UPI000D1E7B7C|nr:hypothetical protein [Staphylococcus simulans]PTI88168.1 hypothetical protein BU053_02560 [Staphylococcus simulans]